MSTRGPHIEPTLGSQAIEKFLTILEIFGMSQAELRQVTENYQEFSGRSNLTNIEIENFNRFVSETLALDLDLFFIQFGEASLSEQEQTKKQYYEKVGMRYTSNVVPSQTRTSGTPLAPTPASQRLPRQNAQPSIIELIGNGTSDKLDPPAPRLSRRGESSSTHQPPLYPLMDSFDPEDAFEDIYDYVTHSYRPSRMSSRNGDSDPDASDAKSLDVRSNSHRGSPS